MKKKAWMLFVAVVCGTSSFAVANDCATCTETTQTVTQEEKKTEDAEVVVVDAPVTEVASN